MKNTRAILAAAVLTALSGMRLLACLIVAPRQGYDEPGFLSYTIRLVCPTSADGLHSAGVQSPQARARRSSVVAAPFLRVPNSKGESAAHFRFRLWCILHRKELESCSA